MAFPVDQEEMERHSSKRKWWERRVTTVVVALLVLSYALGVYELPWYGAVMLWVVGYLSASFAVNVIAMRALMRKHGEEIHRWAKEEREGERSEEA